MELNSSASFVPVIYEAIKMAKNSRRYHILIIISNGHIDDPDMARKAIVEASEYPLCTCVHNSTRGMDWVLRSNLACTIPVSDYHGRRRRWTMEHDD